MVASREDVELTRVTPGDWLADRRTADHLIGHGVQHRATPPVVIEAIVAHDV